MKKCFIICPIGEEGSETRKLSDDFYDLVAEPAIEHEFEVVRADKLSKTSVINDDIVELVQSSDLCIADLSEANANAYYELGRRHECGKPFIQMIRKGHDLKFDVAGIRTIEYSLETPRDVKKSIDAIRAFISNIDFNEMSAGVGGVSIASVAKGIDRLESHMIELKGKLGGSKSLTIPDFDSSEEHIVLKGAQGIKKAILSGNIGLAESLLDGAEDRLGHSQYMECVGMLCLAGSATYKKLFLDKLLILKSSANEGELREVFDVIIPSLVQFYIHRDEEGAAVEELIPILEEFAVKNEVGDKDKALIYFSISKVLANKGDLGEAVEEIDKAISFQPDEKAYASAKQVLIKKISSQ